MSNDFLLIVTYYDTVLLLYEAFFGYLSRPFLLLSNGPIETLNLGLLGDVYAGVAVNLPDLHVGPMRKNTCGIHKNPNISMHT